MNYVIDWLRDKVYVLASIALYFEKSKRVQLQFSFIYHIKANILIFWVVNYY